MVNVQLQKPTLASMIGCMKLNAASQAGSIEEGKGTLKHVEFSVNIPATQKGTSSSSNSNNISATELEWVSAAGSVRWKVEGSTPLAKAENEAVKALMAKNSSGKGGKRGSNDKTTAAAVHKCIVALVKASKSSGMGISSGVINSLLQACAGTFSSGKYLLF